VPLRRNSGLGHTVVLVNMDGRFLNFKTSTSPSQHEPIIQIPKNRATFYQNHIVKNYESFTPKVDQNEIIHLFKTVVGKRTTFIPGQNDPKYLPADEGYLLKLNKIAKRPNYNGYGQTGNGKTGYGYAQRVGHRPPSTKLFN